MSGIGLIIVFVISIVIMILLISKYNVHPFLSIMGTSLALAILSGIPLKSIPSTIGSGFSGIFTSIGLVIIIGALIGSILEKTNAAIKLADTVVKLVGEKNPELAILIMGWIVSIPVFCDSGFVILDPIRKAMVHKTKTSSVTMTVALSAGLYISHVFIPPTPGPIAAAGLVGAGNNLLLIIFLGFIVSIPCLIAGYLYARYIGKKVLSKDEDETHEENAVLKEAYKNLVIADKDLPSGFLSFAPIIVPILLMALSSIIVMFKVSNSFSDVIIFLGSPIIALFVGLIFAIALLYQTKKMNIFRSITEETLKIVGPILFVTAAGGVLGKVITMAGFVEYIKDNASIIASLGMFFPFIISAILKTSQGSSTVALTTTASIMGMYTDGSSMMTALGFTTPMAAGLVVMAIGAGAMTVSHANDSYFWVVTNFGMLKPEDGYKTQTMMTLVMGLTGGIFVYLLSLILL